MSLREKFANLVESAQGTVGYWRDVAITDFTRDLHDRMGRMNMTHAELAKRMGTSRPYVTKLLDGSNFTLETMVKLATALGGVVRVHIADRDALTRWKDESLSEESPTARSRPEETYKLVRCEGGGFVASHADLPERFARGETADQAIEALDQLPTPEPVRPASSSPARRKRLGTRKGLEDQSQL